jgi:hypothetical protein
LVDDVIPPGTTAEPHHDSRSYGILQLASVVHPSSRKTVLSPGRVIWLRFLMCGPVLGQPFIESTIE